MSLLEIKEKVENEMYDISTGLINLTEKLLKNEEEVKKIVEIIYEVNAKADETKILDSILLGIYSSYGKRIFGLNEEIREV